MRIYLALFVAGNIIGRDGIGVFGLELHGRKAPQHRKEQEYHGMGERDASSLSSPPLAPHSLRFITIPLLSSC